MIRMDNNLISQEEMLPLLKGLVNGGEFFVIDIVVGFCFGEGFQMISNGTWFSKWIMLEKNSPCGIVRGINFKFKDFSRVWVNEDWVGGYLLNKFFDSLGAGIT